MNDHLLIPRTLRASAIAAAAGLLALPASATVNIPEGGAVARDSVSVIHLRVLDGCGSEATDRIEIEIPEGVRNVVPASVPGWTVEVETTGDEDAGTDPAEAPATVGEDEQVTLVRWSGGSLPAGQFMDFGLRAYFPDEAGTTFAFPVVQGCGLTEVRWDGERDSENPAPLVAVGNHVGQRELGELEDTVEALDDDVTALAEQLDGMSPTELRDRLGEVETRVDERFPEIVDRMNRLADRITSLEDVAQGETPNEASGS
jgi:periplasmic copper chaperone A